MNKIVYKTFRSLNLPTLGTSGKWNNTVFFLLWTAYFT